MQNTVIQIENYIKKRGRGKVYLVQGFYQFGSEGAVRIALMRLVKSDMIIRVAQGIYVYPKIDTRLGLGVLYPSIDAIAQLIARRDKARIVPTGAYALHALGLSTQVPVNVVYLTDGAPRRIKIYNHNILFKHTVPKNLAYKSSLFMLVVSAMKEIGNGMLSDDDLIKIKATLAHETKQNILADFDLAPAWIRKIIKTLIE